MKTFNEKLSKDPLFKKSWKQIQQLIKQKKTLICKIKAAHPKRKKDYAQIIQNMGQMKGKNLWYPYMGSGLGNGSFVELLDGSIKMDWIIGVGVHFFGHSDLDLLKTAFEASISDLVMQGHLQANKDPYDFSQTMLKYCQKRSHLKHIYLCPSGAMANENALKIIRQYQFPRKRIIAFKHCFAGRTHLMASLTDNPKYREGLPVYKEFDYIPFYNAEDPNSTQKTIEQLKVIFQKKKKQIAALILEPIQGEGGFNSAPPSFFKAIIEECQKEGVLIWADEIQSMGRTTHLFASEKMRMLKNIDILTFGKLTQICGVLYRKELNPKPGLLSQTFMGASTQIAVGTQILNKLINGKFYGKRGKIKIIEDMFIQFFKNLSLQYPHWIRNYVVNGSMVALTPFDGSIHIVNKMLIKLFENGLIAFSCGHGPYKIRFLIPAGCITKQEIQLGFQILTKTFHEIDEINT